MTLVHIIFKRTRNSDSSFPCSSTTHCNHSHSHFLLWTRGNNSCPVIDGHVATIAVSRAKTANPHVTAVHNGSHGIHDVLAWDRLVSAAVGRVLHVAVAFAELGTVGVCRRSIDGILRINAVLRNEGNACCTGALTAAWIVSNWWAWSYRMSTHLLLYAAAWTPIATKVAKIFEACMLTKDFVVGRDVKVINCWGGETILTSKP